MHLATVNFSNQKQKSIIPGDQVKNQVVHSVNT